MTINREDSGLRVTDCTTVFDELSNNNKIGRTLAIEWMENNFDRITQTLDISRSVTWIIDGFLISSNSQNDIDLVKQFVNEHEQDLQGSISSIQESLSKAELIMQWNELHAEQIFQWLTEHYGKDDDDDENSATSIFNLKYLLMVFVIGHLANQYSFLP